MKSAPSTDRCATQEQAAADQIDCDLDRLARRCLSQALRNPEARVHWEKIAKQIDNIRAPVRQRMSEFDRKATA